MTTSFLTFHIIYIQDTVRFFYRFVYTLLEHSDCHFCLVSNACLAEEKQLLQDMCQSEERLTFCDLPTSENWIHGKALSYLYQLNTADFFCFMDSDIFATGPFMEQFQTYLLQHGSISSCSSLWMLEAEKKMPTGEERVGGRYHTTADGINVGSSYFSIYNCKMIEQRITREQITFERIDWWKIAPSLQKQLKNNGLVYKVYDTAKLINLRLHLSKESSIYLESRYLIHLGATSADILRKGHLKHKKIAELFYLLPESYYKRQFLTVAGLGGKHISYIFKKFGRKRFETSVRKAIVSRYMVKLINCLLVGKDLPSTPWFSSSEKEVQIRLEEMLRELQELFRRFPPLMKS